MVSYSAPELPPEEVERLLQIKRRAETARRAGDEPPAQPGVAARPLDLVRVKGKREPVVIYELLGLGRPGPGQAAFLAESEWGLSAYKGQRWEEAMAHFRAGIALAGPDPCSQMYLARCEAMRLAPPGPGWDGVYEMLHK